MKMVKWRGQLSKCTPTALVLLESRLENLPQVQFNFLTNLKQDEAQNWLNQKKGVMCNGDQKQQAGINVKIL